MSTISETMTADHRRCDEIFSAAEASVSAGAWVEAVERFRAFRRATERHFEMEETVLFPRFEGATGQSMGPTQVMRMEHIQMRRLLDEMEEAVSSRNGDDYLGFSDTLMLLMQQHNMKEERMLYPMTDQALAGELDEVLDRMGNVAD